MYILIFMNFCEFPWIRETSEFSRKQHWSTLTFILLQKLSNIKKKWFKGNFTRTFYLTRYSLIISLVFARNLLGFAGQFFNVDTNLLAFAFTFGLSQIPLKKSSVVKMKKKSLSIFIGGCITEHGYLGTGSQNSQQ